ncbi:MAG: hypothetical protein ACYCWW_19285 [Deltaproteobacteria bacterium]
MLALLLAAALGTAPNLQAQQLARRSIVEYDAGEFEKALADATRAYELAPVPGLLYNLGQCHRALHHWERAAFFYRGYLRGRPDAKNRGEVRALIAEMETNEEEEKADRREAARGHSPAPPAAPAAVAPVAPRLPAASLAVVPAPANGSAPLPAAPPAALVASGAPATHATSWVLGSLGAVGVVGGAVAWGLMQTARGGYLTSGIEPMSYASIQSSNTEAIVGDILVPVGVALLATAIGVAIFDGPPAPEATR